MLHCFPELTVTIVEIDPVVVDLATEHFPLVAHYRREGRLRVLVDDATHALAEGTAHYDAAFVDLYGDTTAPLMRGIRLYELLRARADTVWVNVVDTQDPPMIGALIEEMRTASLPIGALFKPSAEGPDAEEAGSGTGHWMIGSQMPDLDPLRRFTPFSTLREPIGPLLLLRATWRAVVRQLEAQSRHPRGVDQTLSALDVLP
jgi:hypothetical protein